MRFTKRAVLASIFVLSGLGVVPSGPARADDVPGTVRVDVSSFRDRAGLLGCRLHSDPKAFPDATDGPGVAVAIEADRATCLFENVAAGTYAVAVMHDANQNGKVDKNFLGMPTEGYGVSNNRTYAFKPPRWHESKFTVAPGESVSLAVTLRY